MLRQILLVFGVGIGLGLAWKSGWVPLELGPANTGSLEESRSEDGIDPNDVKELTATPEPAVITPDDQALLAAQSEPPLEITDPIPRRTGQPEAELAIRLEHPSVSAKSRVISAKNNVTAAGAEQPEWAAEPEANQAGRVQAADLTPRQRVSGGRSAASSIRLAANQEPQDKIEDLPEAPQADSPLAAELAAIDEQIANEEFLNAHRALSKLYWHQKDRQSELLPRLDKTARKIFFEPRPHLVEPYVVQANDQLRMVAGKYQLSWEYLAKLNRTDPKRVQLGQKLKVLKGPFAAVVDLKEFALTVHLQGYFVKRYSVGIGRDDASPIGKFSVLNKIENPQYTGTDGKVISADDPANPLGERWIDLGDSYGIHGTIEPDSIGKATSRGCIRMRDQDIIEVYDFLVKGSEVVIRK